MSECVLSLHPVRKPSLDSSVHVGTLVVLLMATLYIYIYIHLYLEMQINRIYAYIEIIRMHIYICTHTHIKKYLCVYIYIYIYLRAYDCRWSLFVQVPPLEPPPDPKFAAPLHANGSFRALGL